MGYIELVILAISLAMDAFAVAICKGLAMKKSSIGRACIVGAWFGGFQGLMPFLGFLLGTGFASFISSVDHWIAFILLSLIGGNMIKEAIEIMHGKEEELDESLGIKAMLPLAIATSIDALAVGVTFAFLEVNVIFACLSIGIITFIISSVGVFAGNIFGSKYSSKAQLLGGAVLVILGIKILVQSLFFYHPA